MKSSEIKEELAKLKSELNDLQALFELRLRHVSQKLHHLEKQLDSPAETPSPEPAPPEISRGPVYPAIPSHAAQSPKEWSWRESPELRSPLQNSEAAASRKKSSVLILLQHILECLLGPLVWLWEYAAATYQHFKKANKLTEFFLTAFGIILLLTGTGFTLQKSFHYLTMTGKLGAGFAASIGIIALGSYLHRTQRQLSGYSAGLIGLGISLNYLCIYFLSSYYHLTSPAIGFLLIILNTIAAILLSLKHETRIAAVVTLLGGAFSPLYLREDPGAAFFYFAYLWILSGASIFLAVQIKWPQLQVFSVMVGLTILEFSLSAFPGNMSVQHYLIVFHAFAYLAIYTSLFSNLKLKTTLQRKDVILLIFVISLFVFNLFYVLGSGFRLGIFYASNALIFGAPALAFRRSSLPPNIHALLFLLSGSLIGLAIPAILTPQLTGLFWTQEALSLIFCGFLFRFPSVRKGGYLLGSIALIKMLTTFPQIIHAYSVQLFTNGYVNLLITGALLYGIAFLINRYRAQASPGEQRIRYIARELLSIWFTAFFLITLWPYLETWTLNLSALLMFLLLYRGIRQQLPIWQYSGMAVYSLLLCQIFLSISEADTLRFAQQSLAGKLAIVEALASLWLLKYFYPKHSPGASLSSLMKGAEQLFYVLLPFTLFSYSKELLGSRYEPIMFWGALFINFLLLNQRKYPVLKIEFYTLLIFSWLFSILLYGTLLFSGFHQPGIYILGSGLLIQSIIFMLSGGYQRIQSQPPVYQTFIKLFPYYVGSFIFCLSLELSENFSLTLLILCSYFLTLIRFKRWLQAIRGSFYFCFRLTQFLLLLAYWQAFSTFSSSEIIEWPALIIRGIALYLLYQIVYHDAALYITLPRYPLRKRQRRWQLDLYILHALIAGTYIHFLHWHFDWNGPLLTILLVCQGIFLIFQTLDPRYTLLNRPAVILFAATALKLVLYDLRDFSFFEKTIVTMLLGIILLISAYGFQKLKLRYHRHL